jgi:hypothetical protein
MLIPWNENGRRTGPAAKNPEKSTTCLNLGQINQCALQVTNIPRYFRTTGKFSPVFCPPKRAFGGEIVPVQKNFRNISRKSS